MYKYILIFALCSSAQAGFYVEAGIGKNGLAQDYWIARDSTACMVGFGYVHRFDNYWTLDGSYRHNSQCTVGQGFDERPENVNDSVGIYIRHEWR